MEDQSRIIVGNTREIENLILLNNQIKVIETEIELIGCDSKLKILTIALEPG